MELDNGVAFSHIGVYVHDLQAMEQFYVDLLDFTVTDRGLLSRDGRTRSVVFLSRDPDEHHQIVLADGRPKLIDFNPINQISMRVKSFGALARFHQRFRDAGRTETDPVTHGNAVSFYAPDPEGNRLELYWNTPWYVSQPMVQPIDLARPEAVLMAEIEQQAQGLPGFRPKSEWRAEICERMRQKELASWGADPASRSI